MANTNTLTTNYSLPVPELGNAVTYDIPRIKSALTTVDATLFAKQDALVSAVNVKTVNGNSLLGSGDIAISSGGGSGLTPTTIKTANYTAAAGELVRCNSTAGIFSITLPASPADGAIVAILDIGNTFGTNNVTVLPNTGKTIESDTSLILDITGTYVSFVYNSSATNWRLLETPSVPLASNTALVNTGSVTNINGILSGDGSTLTGITLKTINGNALTGSGNITVTVADGALGTPVSGILTNCTGYTYANLSGTIPTWNQNTTGTASNVTGTVAIANGGTGATTAVAALTALGAQAALSNASTSVSGILTSTDWNTFNGKQAALSAATTSTNGYLTSTDWTTFNSKQASLVSGTSIKTVGGNSLLGSGDIAVLTNAANTLTALQTFSGSSTQLSSVFTNMAEVTTVTTLPSATLTYYTASQSVILFTSNATNNWTLNITHSAGTTLNAALAIGQSITIAFAVTNSATAYYNSATQIDGVAVTPKWQGGTAPTAGNVSSLDTYTFTVIKTAASTYTVLASLTKFA
jgi:hypothetical protein